MNNEYEILSQDAISLLKELIQVPSYSKEENETALAINDFMRLKGIPSGRIGNNIYALNKGFDPRKPTILLNSHHDTVRPVKTYSLDPFNPLEKEGKLFGLGSNDAGGSLVSLIMCFIHFYQKPSTRYNLVLAATAEEEISGKGGIEMLLQSEEFQKSCGITNDFNNWTAIVGEPTKLEMAIAERGLLVLDCTVEGKAGHAAREEGENAIYKTITDIEWIRNYKFPKVSDLLGPVKMTVTVINTENKSHNIVPSLCSYTVDVRTNELYPPEEVIDLIRANVSAEVLPRSTRLKSTFISPAHELVKAGLNLGIKYFGSPTTSDKALIPFPALKIGPGDSARSHTADEFIFTREIKDGIQLYVELLNQLL